MVTFDSAPEAEQYAATPSVAAPGFIATPYVTGIPAQDLRRWRRRHQFWRVSRARDGTSVRSSSGNLYVSDLFTEISTSSRPAAESPAPARGQQSARHWRAWCSIVSGEFVCEPDPTTGDFTTGAVMQINPSTGAVIRTISSDLTCPTAISLDPISGNCFPTIHAAAGDSPTQPVWEISGLSSEDAMPPRCTRTCRTRRTPISRSRPAATCTFGTIGQGAMVTATSGPNPRSNV